MNYWLLKTEPSEYSFEDLTKEKSTIWNGVRNYQARNNLRKMKKGDLAFIYHSVTDKKIVGIAKISKEYFQDPTDKSGMWSVVEVIPHKKLNSSISLEEIKTNKKLSNIALIKQSRLSVMPLSENEFKEILKLSEHTQK